MARLRRLVDSRAAGAVSSAAAAAARANGASVSGNGRDRGNEGGNEGVNEGVNEGANGAANGNGAAERLFEDWRGAMARYTPQEHQAALTLLTRLIEPAAGAPRARPDA